MDYKNYELKMKQRPHVVILGAGASCAAIPNGDFNGKKISAMNGFIEKLGLNDVLQDITFQTQSSNLEDLYMELDERSVSDDICLNAKIELENRIYNFMCDYKIPSEPTVYDFLILSLTSKDLIVTFNWDPLLIEAYQRVSRYTKNLPRLGFLHGNVTIGYCEDDKIIGISGHLCSRCGKKLTKSNLLYPIKNKDYQLDFSIKMFWNELQKYLKSAYMVTVFGYSAPKSDQAAINLLKEAWGDIEQRNFEEIEIIDLRDEDDIIDSWADFIHTHHYSTHKSFFTSTLAICPRRSCEATFDMLMKNQWLKGNTGFRETFSFEDIQELLQALFVEENELQPNEMLSHPY